MCQFLMKCSGKSPKTLTFQQQDQKKRGRESVRARERESILYGTQEWPSEQQVLLWHPRKETSSFHMMGLLGGIYSVQHAPPPSNCPGGHLLPRVMRNALCEGTSVPHELCRACVLQAGDDPRDDAELTRLGTKKYADRPVGMYM